MTVEQTRKLAKHICRLLKVTDIQFPIGKTAKGNFGLVFNENGDYEMFLDAVPLSTKNLLTDENNIELKRMVEKYWFEQEHEIKLIDNHFEKFPVEKAILEEMEINAVAPKKKAGRPAKKN